MKKLFSIFLVILVLIPNLGLATNAHFCMGRLVESSLSWGITDLQCGMEKAAEACDNMPTEQDHHDDKDDCCNNEHQIIQTDEEQTTPSLLIPFQPVFTAVILYALTIPSADQPVLKLLFNDYSPPYPVPDLQALYQSFLI